MPLDPTKIEVLDDQMAEIYRRKTPAERQAIGHAMWRHARKTIEASVRWQYPEWDDKLVREELNRRLLGGHYPTAGLPRRGP
jgi:hypothetical protein